MSNRFILDTNILVLLITNDFDEISNDVRVLLEDRSNVFYTSSVSVLEILQLFRIGKVRFKKGQKIDDVLKHINEVLFVEIIPFTEVHTKTLSGLEIYDGHNDPFDHAIISQTITDRYTLISSDRIYLQTESLRSTSLRILALFIISVENSVLYSGLMPLSILRKRKVLNKNGKRQSVWKSEEVFLRD